MENFNQKSKGWNPNETKMLIEVWSEFEEQLKGNIRNKEVFLKMESKLKDLGVERDWNQIKNKIKNLRHEYKSKSPGNTGSSPSDWIWFNDVHQILHNRHYFNNSLAPIRETEQIVELEELDQTDETTNLSLPSTPSSITSDQSFSSNPKRKRKRVNDLEKEKEVIENSISTLIQKFQESEEENRKDQQIFKEELTKIGSNLNELIDLMKQQFVQNQNQFIPNQSYYTSNVYQNL